MSSTFGGYSIAASGMSVSQTALTVTSHNLSNINTTGYSRKVIASEEKVIACAGQTSLGSGVSVQEIVRARNKFLDATYRQQNAAAAYWEAKDGNLEDIQVALNEFTADDGSSDNGLQQTIEEFFNSWEELSKDPSSLSNRQAVIECAESLITVAGEIDSQLKQLQYDAAAKVKEEINQLNDLAGQVADLNAQIKKAEASGIEASDLRDQRDAILDDMSGLANITVREQTGGTLEVTIGGTYLVQGNKNYTLTASGDGSADNPLTITWAASGQAAQITSGSIAAYMEDADQSSVLAIDESAIPYNFKADSTSSISNLRQGLNDLITTIVMKVNEIHSANVGLSDSVSRDFFVPSDDSKPLSLSNIQVNPDIADNTNNIAVSTSGDAGDGSGAAAIALIVNSAVFAIDGLNMDVTSFYQGLISWLGTAGDTANSNYETQSSLVSQVDNQRMSVSSVSLDEEMSKMIMYQNAYSASARVLSVMDGLVEDLIAELG